MGTPTYTPMANITLSSSAASVTFSSISQAYRDLVLVMSTKSSASVYVSMRFNADSGSTYTSVEMEGTGSAAGSGTVTTTYLSLGSGYTDTTQDGIVLANIMDYSATDKHKSVLGRSSKAGWGVLALAGRWANTSAITSLQVFPSSGTWTAGSTFALYGIVA